MADDRDALGEMKARILRLYEDGELTESAARELLGDDEFDAAMEVAADTEEVQTQPYG